MIRKVGDKTPQAEKAAFIAENASVLGDVTLGSGSFVWYGAVVRGDVDAITAATISSRAFSLAVQNACDSFKRNAGQFGQQAAETVTEEIVAEEIIETTEGGTENE